MEKKILEWAIANTDNTSDAPRQQTQIYTGVLDAIMGKSDAIRMRETVEVISKPDETLENKEIAFDNLELLVEQIDNAINLENLNLWPSLISFLSLPETSLRKHAIWVCGTAMQNNIRAQKAFCEKGGLQVIINILKNEQEDVEVRSKALYAVSGAIKHYPPGLVEFDKEGGYEALLSVLQSSDDLPTLRKTVFLFNTLLLQNPTTVTTRLEEKGLAKQIIKLLTAFGGQDEDLFEKILRTLLTLFQNSAQSLNDEKAELKRILPELKSKYRDVVLSTEEWDKLEK